MKKLLVTIAAAALVGLPLAAHAQNHDGYQSDGGDRSVRSATMRGRDADARSGDRYAWRRGGARSADFDRRRFGGRQFDRGFDRDRGFGRRDGFGGAVVLGFGGGYPYGGDYGATPYGYDGYGADYAYSYPDAYGTYQPFDYSYSAGDDAYHAEPYDEGGAYAAEGAPYDNDDDGYQTPPDEGWSAGAPPADCGQWAWRDERGAYEWIPAPCGEPRG